MKKQIKERGLSEGSELYRKYTNTYEEFSKAEDVQNKVIEFLIPRVQDKIVVDFCCGNGKYAKVLAKETYSYTGIDISPQQIELAKKTCKDQKNTFFFVGDATNLSLASEMFDLVICTWGISSITSSEDRKQVLKELERVTAQGGTIYIIENSPFDEFHKIRGLFYQLKNLSIAKLILNKGFKFDTKLNTYFKFRTVNEANELLFYFWPDHIKEKISSRILNHEIIVFKKEKNE